MKISIDDEVLSKHKLTRAQFFFMLHLSSKITDEKIKELIDKRGFVTTEYNGNIPTGDFKISINGIKTINKVILESDGESPDQKKRIDDLVTKLQEIFPEGKKQGTNHYWRGNKPEIKDKLLSFFKKFGEYDDEVIINATQAYVNSYKQNPTTMRTLKYFISKRDQGDWVYDLLTWIENIDSNVSPLQMTRLI